MKRNNWFSAIALALSSIACIVTWLRVEIYTTNDTFVGIMAAFMGVCATLIVGVQIYNSLEYKNRLESVASLQKQLQIELQLIRNERIVSEHTMRYGINTAAGISLFDKNPLLGYEAFFKAIIEALEVNEAKYIKGSLTNLRSTVLSLKHMIKNDNEFSHAKIKTIEQDTNPKLLSEYKSYFLIKSEYNTIYNDMISEIQKINGKSN